MNLLVVIIIALISLAVSYTIYTRHFGLSVFVQEPQSLSGALRSMLFVGAVVAIISFGGLICIGLLDPEYTSTLQGVLGMAIIAILISVLCMLGFSWQLFIVGKYRGVLFSELRKRRRSDQVSREDNNVTKQ